MIAVTGASGYIGRATLQWLSHEGQVVGVSRSGPAFSLPPSVSWRVTGDAAPNERATWDADKNEIQKAMQSVLGPGTEATYDERDPKGPFTVRVRAPSSRPLAEVLGAAKAL